MANCSNCYNGCVEITSDKCVMYTGVDVPVLGIVKGDSLSYVEQALVTFLTSTLNGSGITIEMNASYYCTLISQYLQSCSTVTALDLFKALVQAACDLQDQINTVNTTLTTLNADYTVDCLAGVTNSSDTHDVLQTVITKLCAIDDSLAAVILDLDTNYVKIADVNTYVAAYIASTAGATRYSSRMVPYAIQAYYGSLGVFDATGAGLAGTEWEDIYLCNGLNGTPDLRGRVIVGTIVGVPGGALASEVDPGASPFNPNYSLGTLYGANSIVLSTAQMPSHTHVLTDPGHTHSLTVDEVSTAGRLSGTNYLANYGGEGGDSTYALQNAVGGPPDSGQVQIKTTGITIANTGSGSAHGNTQPVAAAYFIMYIP